MMTLFQAKALEFIQHRNCPRQPCSTVGTACWKAGENRTAMFFRSAGKLLMTLGVIFFISAVAWWLVFFEQMLGTAVKQASQCFYYTTVECEAVAAIDLFFDVPAYSPMILWLAGGLFAAGALLCGVVDHAPAADSDQPG